MTNLSDREKKLLVFTVILIAGFSLYSYLLAPAYGQYREMKEKVNELEHNLQKEKMELQGREKYQRELVVVSREIIRMEDHIYDPDIKKARMDFINEVDGELQDNNLQVQNKDINITSPEEDRELTSLEYQLSFAGELLDVLRFLNGVNLGEKLYRIKELEIQADQNMENLSVYTVITAYCKEGENDEEV
ncbi:MAG: hypothetical protein ACOC5A_06180 [Halanaerobiales bacterium]